MGKRCKIDDNGRECTTCGEYKTWDNFSEHDKGARGKQPRCKDCWTKLNRESYEKIKKDTDRFGIYISKKIKKRKERIHRDPIKQRAIAIASGHKARMKKLGKPIDNVPTSSEIHQWLLDKQPITCAISGHIIENFEVDHKIPVSRGGEHSLENLQILSREWNKIKGNLTDMELSQILDLISNWEEDGRVALLNRLRAGGAMFLRK